MIVVYIYTPELQLRENHIKHQKMIAVEDTVRAAGYQVTYYEGNGFISGVEFTNKEEAARFTFKFLR